MAKNFLSHSLRQLSRQGRPSSSSQGKRKERRKKFAPKISSSKSGKLRAKNRFENHFFFEFVIIFKGKEKNKPLRKVFFAGGFLFEEEDEENMRNDFQLTPQANLKLPTLCRCDLHFSSPYVAIFSTIFTFCLPFTLKHFQQFLKHFFINIFSHHISIKI